jgi:hypothetical protein
LDDRIKAAVVVGWMTSFLAARNMSKYHQLPKVAMPLPLFGLSRCGRARDPKALLVINGSEMACFI